MVYERCVGCTVPLCHAIFSPSSIILADFLYHIMEVGRLGLHDGETGANRRALALTTSVVLRRESWQLVWQTHQVFPSD